MALRLMGVTLENNMGIVTMPQPVKAVIGVLTAEPGLLSTVYAELTQRLGPIDFTSELAAFHKYKLL